MRKINYYCDKCGEQITGPKYQLGVFWTDMEDPVDGAWDLDTGADLCEDCYKECDDMVAWFIKHPAHHFSAPNDPVEQPDPKPKRKNIKHGTGGRKKDLDLGRMAALRNAGWSLEKIADELRCSAQTVANRMEEAQAFLRRQNLATDLEEALENDIQEG